MPRLKFIFSIFFLLSIHGMSYAVVILVHGSFSTSSIWHSTDGAFFKSLEESAKTLNQSVVTFNWSGTPTQKEITKAGKMLAKLIASYHKDDIIILIGHSHGGNVINIASQKLYDIEAEILERASHVSADDLEKVLSAKHGLVPDPVHIQTNKLNYEFDFIVTTRNPEKNVAKKHQYKIDSVYLLGTPVDTQIYAPQMSVIQYLFNFYSSGDGVQTVVWFYGKKYPIHERITNIQLKIRDGKTNQDYDPSHRGVHHSIVGGWLLLIPFKLKADNVEGFKEFELGKNYAMTFQEKSWPITVLVN